jgi:hypothetical protein
VIARQPLGIQQGQRTRHDRDRQLDPENLLAQVGRIDFQHDGAGVGLVERRRHVGARREGERGEQGGDGQETMLERCGHEKRKKIVDESRK